MKRFMTYLLFSSVILKCFHVSGNIWIQFFSIFILKTYLLEHIHERYMSSSSPTHYFMKNNWGPEKLLLVWSYVTWRGMCMCFYTRICICKGFSSCYSIPLFAVMWSSTICQVKVSMDVFKKRCPARWCQWPENQQVQHRKSAKEDSPYSALI